MFCMREYEVCTRTTTAIGHAETNYIYYMYVYLRHTLTAACNIHACYMKHVCYKLLPNRGLVVKLRECMAARSVVGLMHDFNLHTT